MLSFFQITPGLHPNPVVRVLVLTIFVAINLALWASWAYVVAAGIKAAL